MTKDELRHLKDQPIGVFDSGLGGLTVVHELMGAMAGEDIIYLGDSARAPYGPKSQETVRRFAMEAAGFLLQFKPKMLVVACNTASALALELLQQDFAVPVIGVLEPGAEAAVAVARGSDEARTGRPGSTGRPAEEGRDATRCFQRDTRSKSRRRVWWRLWRTVWVGRQTNLVRGGAGLAR